MNKALLIFALAGWILLMGLFGFAKTGVLMPLLVNGVVALRTTIYGWFTYRGSKWGYYLTMLWLVTSTITYIYYCFNENSFYKVSSGDGYLMFGSMAIFSTITFVYLLKLRRNYSKQAVKA